jgi:hypothetical protein
MTRKGQPARLSPAGTKLWASVTAQFELEGHASALLTELCRTADTMATLQQSIDRDGVMVRRSFKGPASGPLRGHEPASPNRRSWAAAITASASATVASAAAARASATAASNASVSAAASGTARTSARAFASPKIDTPAQAMTPITRPAAAVTMNTKNRLKMSNQRTLTSSASSFPKITAPTILLADHVFAGQAQI